MEFNARQEGRSGSLGEMCAEDKGGEENRVRKGLKGREMESLPCSERGCDPIASGRSSLTW
jgi:hypothetical protein